MPDLPIDPALFYPTILVPWMEFLLFNSGFNLHHDIWGDWIHFMSSFCVFCNFSHQFSFGGSRGLKPTVLSKTYKRWHLLHQSVIIWGSIYFYPALQIWSHLSLFLVEEDAKHITTIAMKTTLSQIILPCVFPRLRHTYFASLFQSR